MTLDAAGDLLIADTANYVVRFVPVTSGTYFGQSMSADDIYTIAGTGTSGYSGNGGPATSAKFANVLDATFDASGNVLIVDSGNDYVRFLPRIPGECYGQLMTANDIYTIVGEGASNDLNRDGFRVDQCSSILSNLHAGAQSARPLGCMSP